MSTTEEHVRYVIARVVASVMPDLRAQDVDFARTLSDYGCNSLDRADIVSLSMEDLGVDIPVGELSRISNLRELTDALCYQLRSR
ncbi:phosphopantetheine-binding protein [Mycobacterium stomatepiae]|uniref:Carrier domain-containing protein n=1 Tax=Mycobacterium stomatepiae TaxID=470076 RepID=A0A7I7Q7C3_9MYCO|nr:poly(3-hydroxyalkanoate) depolymerase [Mycobacterium stomatepiae]BBY22234.1 hypothetical protein MSTO_24390 [Mycobacterium stomatepiae]